MGKLLDRILTTPKFPWLLLLLITLPSFYSVLRPGFFSMYDDMQVIRLDQMDKCVRDLQIPCRWVPDLGYGYGYPLFIYYAPLPYYIMELFHLIGFGLIDSVKIGFVLTALISSCFMYLLSRKFFSREASLVSLALYVYLPARLTDFYVKGAMGELWGLALLPAFFWGLENLLEKQDKKSLLVFGMVFFLFLISHNLTVFLTIPLAVIWFLIRVREKNIDLKGNLSYFLKSLFLGLALASFYVVPLIFERQLVHIDTLTSGYFNYINHFVSLKQLLFSFKWGYGPSVVGPGDDTSLSAGPIQAAGVALSMVAFLLSSKMRKPSTFFVLLIISFWVALFMSHSRSTPIWQAMPFLSFLQFPFRFLIIAGFSSAILGGMIFDTLASKIRPIAAVLTILILILSYRNFLGPKDWFYITDSGKLSGESLDRQLTASIYDYLPKVAQKAPDAKAPGEAFAGEGLVVLKNYNRGTNWYDFEGEVLADEAVLVFPSYNYPEWKIWVNDSLVRVESYSELGLLSTTLDRGSYQIRARLTGTLPRKLGDMASFVGITTFFAIVFSKREYV